MNSRRPLTILLAVTALLSLSIALLVKPGFPMPGYYLDVIEWTGSGHITSSFVPLAYPLFIGVAFRLAGISGIIALQLALQIAIAAICYGILRELRLPPNWSAYGSLPVALHPQLVLSVVKFWDVSLSTFLLLFFVFLCLRIAHSAPRPVLWHVVVTGLAFAASIFCRPNLILLLAVVLLVLLRHRDAASAGTLGMQFAAFMFIAVATFSLLGIVSHGSVFFPGNGPYNLYAGHNPHTVSSLLGDLNAENALALSFHESHPDDASPQLDAPALAGYYTRQSILFARQNPIEEVKLIFVKLFTFFRPDTKVHRLLSGSGFFMGLLALPAVLFLAALLWPGRPPLSFEDKFLFVVELLYLLPFLITNADPRFRTPLDAILLLQLVSLVYRRRAARLTPLPA